jgi:hypothetical protein
MLFPARLLTGTQNCIWLTARRCQSAKGCLNRFYQDVTAAAILSRYPFYHALFVFLFEKSWRLNGEQDGLVDRLSVRLLPADSLRSRSQQRRLLPRVLVRWA